MSDDASIPTILVILLVASLIVVIAGIVMAAKGSGRVRTIGWWVAIVAGLFVAAWGTVLAMGALVAG